MHGKVQRGLLIVLTGEQLGKGRGVMRINRTTSKRKRRSLSVLSMVVFVIVKQDLGIESPLSSKVASSSTSEESELECINKVSVSESSPPWSSLCVLPVFLETICVASPPLCCCFGVGLDDIVAPSEPGPVLGLLLTGFSCDSLAAVVAGEPFWASLFSAACHWVVLLAWWM